MSLTVCITCCNKDLKFLPLLLEKFKLQTEAPEYFIVSSSGLNEQDIKNMPSSINIQNKDIAIKHINYDQKNMYAGYARNQGTWICDTDYIMMFDVDDIPHPRKIEFTYQAIKESNFDLFVHNYFNGWGDDFNFPEIKNLGNLEQILEKENGNTNLKATGWIHHGHVTVRRSVFNKVQYNEEMPRGQDGDFCQRVLDNKFNVIYSPHKLLFYRYK